MNNLKFILVLCLVFVLASCEFLFPDRNGKFMRKVINLSEFNSEYDDYNSDLPRNKHGEFYLVFSSKRDKKEYYNLVGFPTRLQYDDHPRLVVAPGSLLSAINHGFVRGYAILANGNYNVLGPKVLTDREIPSYAGQKNPYEFMFFADDKDGHLNIKVIYKDSVGLVQGPVNVAYLNSDKNDAYPSFDHGINKVWFCSDRTGDFDIYEAELSDKPIERTTDVYARLLAPPAVNIKRLSAVSSAGYQDKCPMLWNDDLLVFASDRPGGYGGFDLYYSKKVNGQWQEPVNAGPRINTAHDEYRPLLPVLYNFTYPLMIFSSNRPGGKGGFDLYMTGLEVK